MVLKSISWLTIALIILAAVLFVMMLNFIIKIALLILIVLGIIWLWRQVDSRGKRR